jgi:hypothetical protein
LARAGDRRGILQDFTDSSHRDPGLTLVARKGNGQVAYPTGL